MDILIHRHKSLHHPPPPCLFLFVQDTEYAAAVFLASKRFTKSRIFFLIGVDKMQLIFIFISVREAKRDLISGWGLRE